MEPDSAAVTMEPGSEAGTQEGHGDGDMYEQIMSASKKKSEAPPPPFSPELDLQIAIYMNEANTGLKNVGSGFKNTHLTKATVKLLENNGIMNDDGVTPLSYEQIYQWRDRKQTAWKRANEA